MEIPNKIYHKASSRGLVCQQTQNKEVEGKGKNICLIHMYENSLLWIAFEMTAGLGGQ
jgi:hypothetical protein